MTTDPPTGSARITRRHRNLVVAAAVMTTLLVVLGGIVCATESGAGCPDWPGCYGRIVPPPQVNAVIEYTHRLVAGLTTPAHPRGRMGQLAAGRARSAGWCDRSWSASYSSWR